MRIKEIVLKDKKKNSIKGYTKKKKKMDRNLFLSNTR